jgi:lipopolysaccharide export system protein LptC
MATNLRQNLSGFTSEDTINVLFSEEGLRSPRMITADMQYFTKSDEGQIVIPPGYVWQKLSSGLGRILPQFKAAGATTTSSAVIKTRNVNFIKVGEVLVKGAAVVGTVQSVNPTDGEITLAANAAVAVAAGDVLNVQGMTTADLMGINISVLNLTSRSNDVACYTSCSVYAARMPQWNSTIAAAFPEITTV